MKRLSETYMRFDGKGDFEFAKYNRNFGIWEGMRWFDWCKSFVRLYKGKIFVEKESNRDFEGRLVRDSVSLR